MVFDLAQNIELRWLRPSVLVCTTHAHDPTTVHSYNLATTKLLQIIIEHVQRSFELGIQIISLREINIVLAHGGFKQCCSAAHRFSSVTVPLSAAASLLDV